MTALNSRPGNGESGHDPAAAAALSISFCHDFANCSSHVARAPPYLPSSALVTSFASAVCGQEAYLASALFFPDWYFCSGVPGAWAALATNSDATIAASKRMFIG